MPLRICWQSLLSWGADGGEEAAYAQQALESEQGPGGVPDECCGVRGLFEVGFVAQAEQGKEAGDGDAVGAEGAVALERANGKAGLFEDIPQRAGREVEKVAGDIDVSPGAAEEAAQRIAEVRHLDDQSPAGLEKGADDLEITTRRPEVL